MDLLVIAGDAAEVLERYGFVACGRRQDGVARVDFWSRDDGKAYRYELHDEELTVADVVAACLAVGEASVPTPPSRRTSPLS
jgi:hypothetical protein